jgi:hypothetical protein
MLWDGSVANDGVVELERCPHSAVVSVGGALCGDCTVDEDAGAGTGDGMSSSLGSGEDDMLGRWM